MNRKVYNLLFTILFASALNEKVFNVIIFILLVAAVLALFFTLDELFKDRRR